MPRIASVGFFRLLSLWVAAVLGLLIVSSSGVLTEAAGVGVPRGDGGAAAGDAVEPRPRPGPRTAAVTVIRTGPSGDYPALGTLPAGASLEVLGRDASGAWLAISFPPNSGFPGWLPISEVNGLAAVEALQVVEVSPLR